MNGVSMAEMDEMRRLFYALWSKAEAAPDYDQAQWFRLQKLTCQTLEGTPKT